MRVWYLSTMWFRKHSPVGRCLRVASVWIFYSVFLGAFSLSAFAGAAPSLIHGLWVWKSPTVLEAPRGAEALGDFCKSEAINKVYVSVSEGSEASVRFSKRAARRSSSARR